MAELASDTSSNLTLAGDAAALKHLEQSISGGKHWYLALLEAMGLWTRAEEIHRGRSYHYLVAGEAFDWLLLAERMCEAVDSLLPNREKNALLFHDEPPLDITIDKFKELIGGGKYHQYLNYFYGITVEEALIQAVQEEVRKERWNWGYNGEYDTIDEVYRRIYGATKDTLLRQFRREKGYRQPRSICLTELKEFTYWLFKYRLEQCDKAKVASDTKKGLKKLEQMRNKSG